MAPDERELPGWVRGRQVGVAAYALIVLVVTVVLQPLPARLTWSTGFLHDRSFTARNHATAFAIGTSLAVFTQRGGRAT